MHLYESLSSASLTGPTHLTIGNFDGVHRGHRALIAAMRAEARASGAACGLLTFHPHPRVVLRPDQPVAVLTSLAERLALYPGTGLDFAVVHPFTLDTAQIEADAFLRLLHGHLGLRKLWVGPDFALGRGRQGTITYLEEAGASLGIEIAVIPEFTWETQLVRSSWIRRLLEVGNVEWAAAALGRPYNTPGIVVHGARRGRTLGFPTANLSAARERVVPANGVYACWAWLEGHPYPAVVNIGVRPTIAATPASTGAHRTIEAHLIDFTADIYGRCLHLDYVARLRDEQRFPGLAALQAQIERDRDEAAAILAARAPGVIPVEAQHPRFEEIPHTADWAIRVRGADATELYANAALAMFTLQGAAAIDGPTVRQYIAVAGADPEDLLVRWLSALLWHSETQNVSFQHFHIAALTETSLQATAVGRQGRSDLAHIKAVTYHNLSVTAPAVAGEPWQATVLFDT